MQNRRPAALGLVALALMSSISFATLSKGPQTWIVDVNGGPGADFLNISPAVTAASDGDLILVRPGNYSWFAVDKRLTVIGDPGGVTVVGTVEVQDAPGVVNLVSLTLDSLNVRDCTETVILDEVSILDGQAIFIGPVGDWVVNIENSADVRFIDSTISGDRGHWHHGLRVESSRVELVSSTVTGGSAWFDLSCKPINGVAKFGGDGMQVAGASRVHTSHSNLVGGDGGAFACSFFYDAAPGGSGAVVSAPSQILVTGGSYTGGPGGSTGYYYCAPGGNGISGSGQLRRSNATWTRGLGGVLSGAPNCANGVAVGIANVTATPDDPTLERIGLPVSGFFGGSVKLRVRGDPGAKTRLFLGRQPHVAAPNPNIEVELLLEPLVTIDLGHIPSKGFVTYTLKLGPDLPSSFLFTGRQIIAQASCVYPGGELRRTNSVPLVLR